MKTHNNIKSEQDKSEALVMKVDEIEVEEMQMTEEQEKKDNWALNRILRNAYIQKTDWMIMPDSPLSDSVKKDVCAYRQALREIPQKFDEPETVVWPEIPSSIEKLFI